MLKEFKKVCEFDGGQALIRVEKLGKVLKCRNESLKILHKKNITIFGYH